MDIKILVATHKIYRMPSDNMYVPIHVGKEGKHDFGFIGDNTGENISESNSRFCELTGLYWAWKNVQADYIGLVHYRRHFTIMHMLQRLGKNKFDCVIKQEEIVPILKKYDLVLPKQRKYYIESLYSHFIHLPYTYEKDIKVLRDVIQDLQPKYVDIFDQVLKRSHAHMFNMFIMEWTYFDKYCRWLFPILIEADKRINISGYTPMEARTISFLGEFMIDIWNEKQQIPYKELPVIFMERQNWPQKCARFLIRKFFGVQSRRKGVKNDK